MAALLNYVRGTLGQLPDGMPAPRRTSMGDTLQVDAPTLRGLEVLTSASGRNGSLLSVVDRTVTAAGARLLARQLVAPLTSSEQIGRRLAMVRFLLTNPEVRMNCREDLGAMPDMLRACGRLSLGKGGPRDLGAVRDGLEGATAVTARLRGADDLPSGLASAAREPAAASEGACVSAAHSLRRALTSQLPEDTLPGFQIMRRLSLQFRALLRSRKPEGLSRWKAEAMHYGIYALQRFANTLQRDEDAFRNAIAFP